MIKFGLFYGSTTCYTEIIAEKIQQEIGEDKVDIFNLDSTPVELMNDYYLLILGIPTWDFGERQEDWNAVWSELGKVNFKNKWVALYGLGDQLGYGEWFLDAMGDLHSELQQAGGRFLGYWPASGYEFSTSKALTKDGQYFTGLALDEENQFQLTNKRIQVWCQQIQNEYQQKTK